VTLGAEQTLSVPTGVGTVPNVAVAADGHRAAVWVFAPGGGSNGRLAISYDGAAPSVMTDSLGAIQALNEAPPQVAFGPNGTMYVLYVVAKEIPGRRWPASALRLIQSADHGASWSPPMSVTQASAPWGSHNFHGLTVSNDGTLYASWLDGRSGKAATYMTHSTDGGHTWGQATKVSVGETCPCCRTSIAAGPHGLVYLAWRSVFPGNIRDIVVARSSDYGATWTVPKRVHADNWVFGGCPHAGPSLQLDAHGTVHIAWWTGKQDNGGVWYAVSTDSARTFTDATRIVPQEVPLPTHVQLALNPHETIVVWDDMSHDPARIMARVSIDSGRTFGSAIPLSDAQHAAQHPMIALADQVAYVAWSQSRVQSQVQNPEAAELPAPHAASTSNTEHAHGMHASMHMGLPTVGQTSVAMRTMQVATP
jgi:hypothetical protein